MTRYGINIKTQQWNCAANANKLRLFKYNGNSHSSTLTMHDNALLWTTGYSVRVYNHVHKTNSVLLYDYITL